VSRKHHRGRRGHAFKNHFPAKQDDQNDSSNSNEDTSESQSEGHDD
jgi:hypothetical protein